MRKEWIWFTCAMCVLCAGMPAAAVELAARDALTGEPLHARLLVSREGDEAGNAFDLDGRRGAVALAPGHWHARIEAPGHRTLAFDLRGDESALTVLLDPDAEPGAFARLAALVDTQPDARWLQGYVRRALDGAPIADAQVGIDGRDVRSDADGYFEVELESLAPGSDGASTLSARANGFADYRRDGLARVAGVQRVLITLGADTPTQGTIELGARDGRQAVEVPAREAATLPARTSAPPYDIALASPLAPPATIRVGYADASCTQSCCSGSCSNTCVLPLETYVRRGLDSEWIASWNTQSLRAGSIAYRSYGAWRVAHPINANFDICSSACCQVNDAGTSSSTDNAIARTPGLMLTRNGSEAASAEYSAENNSWDDPGDGLACSNSDLSCGDGSAGSPANGWPCLADAVGTGHGCFGHGRGMSQWGTQRWAIDASARRWPWIVDHYFNDNGNATGAGTGQRTALMTSPLDVSAASAVPGGIAPGATIHIAAMATNDAGASHTHLLIGASLYRNGVGYIDDPAHDAPLSLATGSHAITRDFHTPAALAPGSYDLLVSLYLDVDENGTITAADLPLALTTTTHAVQVTDDRIFGNGFDGTS